MIVLLPLGGKKFQIFRSCPKFCSIMLLNNSHVFVLLKKQPLLHDFSSIVSCTLFALKNVQLN